MSFFRATLDALLAKHGMTQAELARRTQIPPAAVSRYLSGMRPETDVVEKLAATFEKDGPSLIVAWLQDSVPDSMQDKITITVADGKPAKGDELVKLLKQLGTHERRTFEELVRRSRANAALLPLLQNVLNLTED